MPADLSVRGFNLSHVLIENFQALDQCFVWFLFLFALFWGQFILGGIVPEQYHGIERVAVGIVYLVLGVWVLVSDRFNFPQLARDAFRAPYDELAREREADALAEAARRQV